MSGRLVSRTSSALLCLFLCILGRVLVLAIPEQFADKGSDGGDDEDDEGAFASLAKKKKVRDRGRR